MPGVPASRLRGPPPPLQTPPPHPPTISLAPWSGSSPTPRRSRPVSLRWRPPAKPTTSDFWTRAPLARVIVYRRMHGRAERGGDGLLPTPPVRGRRPLLSRLSEARATAHDRCRSPLGDGRRSVERADARITWVSGGDRGRSGLHRSRAAAGSVSDRDRCGGRAALPLLARGIGGAGVVEGAAGGRRGGGAGGRGRCVYLGHLPSDPAARAADRTPYALLASRRRACGSRRSQPSGPCCL